MRVFERVEARLVRDILSHPRYLKMHDRKMKLRRKRRKRCFFVEITEMYMLVDPMSIGKRKGLRKAQEGR